MAASLVTSVGQGAVFAPISFATVKRLGEHVGEHQPSTLGREQPRRRRTDATRRTSNDRHLVVDPSHARPPEDLCVEVLAAMITRWAWSVNSCNLPGHPHAWFLHVVCKQM